MTQLLYSQDERLTAIELFNRYRDELPMMVAITEGFHGNREEFNFPVGHILRLHSFRIQKRAVLVADGKKYTLPVECPILFTVLKAQEKSEKKLREIIQMKLPVRVFVFKPNAYAEAINACYAHPITRSEITVIDVQDEPYFIANTILTSTGMPCKTVLVIPLYLTEVRFSPVMGTKSGQGPRDLQSILQRQAQYLTGVNFAQDFSDKGLAPYPEDFDEKGGRYLLGTSPVATEKTIVDVRKASALPPVPPPLPLPSYKPALPPPLPPPVFPPKQTSALPQQPPPLPLPGYMQNPNSGGPYSPPSSSKSRPWAYTFSGKPLLEQMSVFDVHKMLIFLGLDKHTFKFDREKIDGLVLSKMDDDTLRTEFGLTRTEIIRLRVFIEKGHVPK